MRQRYSMCLALLCFAVACSPTPDSAAVVEPLEDVVSVAAGWNHSCAVLADGRMKCWGANTAGQLGDGTAQPRYAPVFVPGITDAIGVAAGESTCALHSDSTVSCWGNGRYSPQAVGGLANVVDIAVGFDRSTVAEPGTDAHICVLIADGGVECWGNNSVGQLGDGTTASRSAPAPVLGVDDAVGIAVGERHSCAVHVTGELSCWGSATAGKLAPGVTVPQLVPIEVAGISDAVEVDAGADHTCVLTTGGSVRCWGAAGLLGGPGSGIVNVDAVEDVITLDVGVSHTCAVAATGVVQCWGSNGHLVLGGAPPAAGHPTTIASLVGITDITTGNAHTCVVEQSDTARCWGDNAFGKLGDATTQPRTTPIVVLDRFPGSDPA